mmetsp:Transcript_26159/g.39197  ORF Transcript_26159/g.39197 Transcript_26159/m.39197 type:complete len:212 (-) Transcript_26159:284-919(-)
MVKPLPLVEKLKRLVMDCDGEIIRGYTECLNLVSIPTSVLPTTILHSPLNSFNNIKSSFKVVGLNHVPALWYVRSTTINGSVGGDMSSWGNISFGISNHLVLRTLSFLVLYSIILSDDDDVQQVDVDVDDDDDVTTDFSFSSCSLSLSSVLQSISHDSRSGHSLHGVPHGPLIISPSSPPPFVSVQSDLAASQMGLYPVQRHRFPSRCSSM